jgi:hypothetical protein
MTTPAQQQQPAPGSGTAAADTALTAALATALVSAASPAAAMTMLLPSFRTSRLQPESMLAVLQVVMSFPPERTGVGGFASLATSRQNALRRAQFAITAGRRVTHDLAEARSQGRPLRDQLAESVARERRYFGQHLDAMWNRAKAAAQVDNAALSYGPLLGWYSVNDRVTSAECRAANGKNFSTEAIPLIGWPGAVHPHCRCYPGPAHIGARMLASAHRIPVRRLVRVA